MKKGEKQKSYTETKHNKGKYIHRISVYNMLIPI
jgi:hypothetical protein